MFRRKADCCCDPSLSPSSSSRIIMGVSLDAPARGQVQLASFARSGGNSSCLLSESSWISYQPVVSAGRWCSSCGFASPPASAFYASELLSPQCSSPLLAVSWP
jgi:hypothetical protein